METIYPAGPAAVPADFARPNAKYRQRAWLASLSLLFFIIVYLGLTSWFCWTAWRLWGEAMAGGDDTMLLFFGSGLSAFLAVFMLKALFFIQRGSDGGRMEITAAEQPRLFEFLCKLADECGAPRPHRVFVSARVNAAVSYDISVLNLLFPSRKNLEIGLGLVNVLTLSEMKAVLAHEFGHFAQRSMAVGTWVYITSQVASQIVARRDALDGFIRTLSRVDLRVAWIGWLLSLILWSIRSLMDTLLRGVLLAQRALSRHMEFQADLVAVSMTGSDELIHALHKLQAADQAWEETLRFAGTQAGQKRAVLSLFSVQTRIIEKLARIMGDEHYGRVPPMPFGPSASHRIFKAGFAQPPEMWSTHPSNVDREENAKRTYLSAPHDARSAWLLFDQADELQKKVALQLLDNESLQPVSDEECMAALDDYYAVVRYDPRYRGAYLSRCLTLHAATADALHEPVALNFGLPHALKSIYTQELANDLSQLRELDEELGDLRALHEKVYLPTGGRIIFRGQEISRRDLPGVMRKVEQETQAVRERILAHDRRVRGIHLAAARQLGQGWHDYLRSLIQLLHYAEHSLADLQDAGGVLHNVYSVVTADGKVSNRERKRLVQAAQGVHEVLQGIYAQAGNVNLGSGVEARLEVSSWAAMLGEFNLPPATLENLHEWMPAIDSWMQGTLGPLSAVCRAALDELLATESLIAGQVQGNAAAAPVAPGPAAVPASYPTLLPGSERKLQRRLGLWDRFQTAQGFFPATARLLVALSIVGAVLGLSASAGTEATISVYNGLGVPVRLDFGRQTLEVPPFAAAEVEAELLPEQWITAHAAGGGLVERFQPMLTGKAQHYVYNVAGATPIVQWTAAYGNASAAEPVPLGLRRWGVGEADIYFAEPPDSVSTKGGGATRTVISAMGNEPPETVLQVLGSDAERRQVIELHARWDSANARHTARWKELAGQLPQ